MINEKKILGTPCLTYEEKFVRVASFINEEKFVGVACLII